MNFEHLKGRVESIYFIIKTEDNMIQYGSKLIGGIAR